MKTLHHLLLTLSAFTVATALLPASASAASATTNPATKVHQTSAVLHGQLDPSGDPGIVDCDFEWGLTAAYGNTVPCNEGDAFGSATAVTATLGGLDFDTTYHFRLTVQTTSSGTLTGADQSFTTLAPSFAHPLVASFGPDGTSATTFLDHWTMAFHQASRRLYVPDSFPPRVYGFDVSSVPAVTPLGGNFPLAPPLPEGSFLSTEYAGVDNSALASNGNLFSAGDGRPEQKIRGYDANGIPLGGNFPLNPSVDPGIPEGASTFGSNICGMAVDSGGEIWMANALTDNGGGRILKYDSTGSYKGLLMTSGLDPDDPNGPCSIAFSSDSDLWAADEAEGIWKFSADGNYESPVFELAESKTQTGGNVRAITVDTSTDRVYILRQREIEILADDGTSLETFSPPQFATTPELKGIAVDSSNGYMYVSEMLSEKIHVFGPTLIPLILPTIATAPPNPLTGTSATLNATVDPEGVAVTDCHFQWGTTTNYGNIAPCAQDPGSGSGDVAVSTDLTGLTPGATYHFRIVVSSANGTVRSQDANFEALPAPAIGAAQASNVGRNAADLAAQVNPRGYATTYRFEYGTTAGYGSSAPVPDGNIGSGTANVPVSVNLTGLDEETTYHWRVVAQNPNGSSATQDATFVTSGPPFAETTGSPVRTATTAQLGGRVYPNNAATTYRFEYGEAGPCDSNPCAMTPDRSAGGGGAIELVSEELTGLQPDSTYHYRLVAGNGHPGGEAIGEDMTVTTRASDAPLGHGRFPGPPGSDRAYELISLPDAGGNPIKYGMAYSDDGDRAVYSILGGTPISETANGIFLAERTAAGWRSDLLSPPRSELRGEWGPEVLATDDLSGLLARNFGLDVGTDIWRFQAGAPPLGFFSATGSEEFSQGGWYAASEDLSRVVTALSGDQLDPAYPAAAAKSNLYDISSGAPELASLLPEETVATCGLGGSDSAYDFAAAPTAYSLSTDGSHLYFPSRGNDCGANSQLYARDLEAAQSTLISGPPVSGPDCGDGFIRSIPGAAFFWTQSRLDPDDTEPVACAKKGEGIPFDGDVYRYDTAAGLNECLTCVLDLDADVYAPLGGFTNVVNGIRISDDGSRLYFRSVSSLLPGVPPGSDSVYRLASATGDLAYVGALGGVFSLLTRSLGMTPDGSVLAFESDDSALNPLGGADNDGTEQLYRYDDRDRSLVCVSCPPDGAAPISGIKGFEWNSGRNITPLSADGETLAFATPTPLASADQNTPGGGANPFIGTDVYEWRDGRLLLVTDGLTKWPTFEAEGPPSVRGVSPSGGDIYFTAPTQYTPDALDGYRRLYTARIGGGFDFPKPPPPCPLEVCQGTPKGTPGEQVPGTSSFRGRGNVAEVPPVRKCRKGQRKVRRAGKVRCVRKIRNRRANHDRRAQR